MAWGWAWQYADQLSKLTADVCRCRQACHTGRYSTSCCLACSDPEVSAHGRYMKTEPSTAVPVVFFVAEAASLRGAVSTLIRAGARGIEAFASTAEVFAAKRPDAACCLVLDVRLPGVSGLDFQAELAKAKIQIPIIFITGHGDIPMTVKAMKAGAVEFLTKPFRDQDLLD